MLLVGGGKVPFAPCGGGGKVPFAPFGGGPLGGGPLGGGPPAGKCLNETTIKARSATNKIFFNI